MKRIISQIAKQIVKTVFISLNILVISNLSSTVALAVGGDYDPNPVYTSNCVEFYQNLKYRSTDANSSGEVSKLQEILQEKGYLSADPTGYFGKLTVAGVKRFQANYVLDQTGYVGTLTRAKLKEISCGTISNNSCPVGQYVSNLLVNSCVCNGTLTHVNNFIKCEGYTVPVIPTYYPACNPNVNYFAQQNCTCQNGSVVSAYTSCSEYYYYNNNNYNYNYNNNYNNNTNNTGNTYCNYDSYGQMYCY